MLEGNNLILLLCAVLGSMAPRFIPVILLNGRKTNKFWEEFFSYIPITVLSAMIMASVFYRDSGFKVEFEWVLASIIGLVIGNISKNLWLTIIIGIISFYFLGKI